MGPCGTCPAHRSVPLRWPRFHFVCTAIMVEVGRDRDVDRVEMANNEILATVVAEENHSNNDGSNGNRLEEL